MYVRAQGLQGRQNALPVRISVIAAVVLALALAAATAACGGSEEPTAEPSAQGSDGLRFTRDDGSDLQLPAGVRAWCGAFDEDNPEVEAVLLLGAEIGEPAASFWVVHAVRADVARQPATTLPNEFVYTEPRGASLFVLDAGRNGNELSSSEEESSGVIRVELEGCDPGNEVRVELDDVVLGSEFSDGPPVRAHGSVVAEIGDEPRRIGG